MITTGMSSVEIGKIAGALAKAQGSFGEYAKTKTAKITSAKGDFSYAYATLADALEAVRTPLSAAEIAIIQVPRLEGEGWLVVRSLLLHSSGEWLASEIGGPVAGADLRALGSAITYLRRYGLLALIGLAADDDDAAGAVARPVVAARRRADALPPPSQPGASLPTASEGASAPTHDLSWADARPSFCESLKRLGLSYDDVAGWLASEASARTRAALDLPALRPSALDQGQRNSLLAALAKAGKRAGKAVANWRAANPPLESRRPSPPTDELRAAERAAGEAHVRACRAALNVAADATAPQVAALECAHAYMEALSLPPEPGSEE